MSTAIKPGRRRLQFSFGAILFLVGAAYVAWLGAAHGTSRASANRPRAANATRSVLATQWVPRRGLAFMDAAIADSGAKKPSNVDRPAPLPLQTATTSAAEPFGIIFSGSSPEMPKIKAEMQQLLIAMGWTANQVQVLDSPRGDSVSYVLSSGTPDTGTFDLGKRPELGLAPETVQYIDRLGQKKAVTLASKKEILATMLGRGRRFEFSGPNCSVDQLKEHIAVRQNVVYWGFRAAWIFPENRAYQYDTVEHWEPMLDDNWTVKSGVKPSKAIADAFVGKSFYIIGCTSACRFIVAHSVFDYFQHVKPNPGVMAGLGASIDQRHPFVGMAPKRSPDGTPPKDGLFLARHVNVP